jgi:hypothetical protein
MCALEEPRPAARSGLAEGPVTPCLPALLQRAARAHARLRALEAVPLRLQPPVLWAVRHSRWIWQRPGAPALKGPPCCEDTEQIVAVPGVCARRHVVSRFSRLTGAMALGPRWSLGFACTAMPLADAPDAQVPLPVAGRAGLLT